MTARQTEYRLTDRYTDRQTDLAGSWDALGRSCCALGCSWAVLGSSWPLLRCSWGALGRSWGALGCSGDALGRSWGAVEVSKRHPKGSRSPRMETLPKSFKIAHKNPQDLPRLAKREVSTYQRCYLANRGIVQFVY